MSQSGVWAILPVKPFTMAKSRLSSFLDEAARAALCSLMLADVIQAVRLAKEITNWGIVSRDDQVLGQAMRQGGRAFVETGHDLNSSLTIVAEQLRQENASGILVLPMDIPLITGEDIDYMVGLAGRKAGVVVSPSAEGDGTNALLVRPPKALTFAFGENSFSAHKALASEARLPAEIYISANTALDIDNPEDLIELVKRRSGRYTRFIPDSIRSQLIA